MRRPTPLPPPAASRGARSGRRCPTPVETAAETDRADPGQVADDADGCRTRSTVAPVIPLDRSRPHSGRRSFPVSQRAPERRGRDAGAPPRGMGGRTGPPQGVARRGAALHRAPAAPAAAVARGRGSAPRSCSRPWARRTARCSRSSRSASSARSSSTRSRWRRRCGTSSARRCRSSTRARSKPCSSPSRSWSRTARGASAARTGRAHRRAHAHRPDPDPRRLHPGRRRRRCPVDDRDPRCRGARWSPSPDGTGSPAFEAIGQATRSLPDSIATQVTAVSASTPDDVTLTLGGANAQVVWGAPRTPR